MYTATSSHWWLSRFVARLLQLRPRSSAAAAIRRAVAAYHRGALLDPDLAADNFYRDAIGSQIVGIRRVTRNGQSAPADSRRAFRRRAR